MKAIDAEDIRVSVKTVYGVVAVLCSGAFFAAIVFVSQGNASSRIDSLEQWRAERDESRVEYREEQLKQWNSVNARLTRMEVILEEIRKK